MKIYRTEYLDLVGTYSGVVIAADKAEAVTLFVKYFNKDDYDNPIIQASSVNVIEIGTAKSKRPNVVMCNNP